MHGTWNQGFEFKRVGDEREIITASLSVLIVSLICARPLEDRSLTDLEINIYLALHTEFTDSFLEYLQVTGVRKDCSVV